ncbi:NB-ARC domain-containing protein [Micromonospora sp. NPDC050397]|uniref:NB-ARC domain-containing protein n=1 Tax=Micromonospora sp. NPDC050397 TaxID=3364279 RepID=UPI00384BB0E0
MRRFAALGAVLLASAGLWWLWNQFGWPRGDDAGQPSMRNDNAIFFATVVSAASLAALAGLLARSRRSRARADDEAPWMVETAKQPFVPRPDLVSALVRSLPGTVALVGAGGFGKTTLAQAICRLPEIRKSFPGGVLWVTVGENPSAADLTGHLEFLAQVVSGEQQEFSDPGRAAFRLGRLLDARPPVLLVIDDVWTAEHLAPFLQGGRRCARLVTTRVPRLLPAGTPQIEVGEMSTVQAEQLLRHWIGSADVAVGPLIQGAARWPLLLSLIGAAVADLVRRGTPARDAVEEHLTLLQEFGPAGLDEMSRDAFQGRLVARTIEASLGRLDPEHRQRCLELGIFREDDRIPLAVTRMLWAGSARLSASASGVILNRLATLSLLSVHEGTYLRLHDVVRSYLRQQLADDTEPALHAGLLEQARAENADESWWQLPDDHDYLRRNLAYHLAMAGADDELSALVQDLRWVRFRVRLDGPVAAESDLRAVPGPVTESIARSLAVRAHLAVPLPNCADATSPLANMLAPDIDTGPLILDREAGCLVPLWAPPADRSSSTRTLIGHNAIISAVVVAADGSWFASADNEAVVRVWDTETGAPRLVLTGDAHYLEDVAASPEGNWIASGGYDRNLRVWDATLGTVRHVLRGHKKTIAAIRALPDGRLLTGSEDGTVRVWHLTSGSSSSVYRAYGPLDQFRRRLVRLCGKRSPSRAVNALAVAPGGGWIAVGTWDSHVHLVDFGDHRIRGTFAEHARLKHHGPWGERWAGPIEAVAISPSGRWAVSCTSNIGVILIWDTETLRTTHRLYHGDRGISAVAISPDSSLIVTGSWDKTAMVWDAGTGALRHTLDAHTNGVTCVAFLPDGRRVVTGSADRTLRIWDLTATESGPDESVSGGHALGIHPRGDWVAAGDGAIHLRDVTTGAVLRPLDDDVWVAGSVAVWNGGRRLGAVGRGYVVGVWDTRTGRHLGTLRPEIESLVATDRVIVTGGFDGYLRLWDPQRLTETHAWQGHWDRISSLALAPDGSWFASSGHDPRVRIWDTGTGASLGTCTGHTQWVGALVVSPAGRWLASSDDEGVIRLWRMPSGETWHVLRGHSNMVRTLAITEDDTLIVSGSWDHTARVWDVATGATVHVLTGHTGQIEVVAVSPDGSLAATGGWDHTVRVWDLRTGRCLAGVTVNERVTGCAWLPGRSTLAATTPSGTYLWSYLPPPE